MKLVKYIISAFILLSSASCTDLDETVYSFIPQDGFYQTKDNVLQGFVRPFGHAFWTCSRSSYLFNELSADQYMIVQREEHWYDGGAYFKLHYHTWDLDDWYVKNLWTDTYRGIIQCNSVISDFQKLEPTKFGMSQGELNDFIAQERVLRAWMYMELFNLMHNIPIVTDYPTDELPSQSSPQETFAFLERELKESLPLLKKKSGSEGNGVSQGLWNQGATAALLARLYMNASWWIGEDRSSDCETLCQDIIDGVYGNYSLAERWDAPFDWDNDKCNEVLYAFPSAYGSAHWHYSWGMYFVSAPWNAQPYYGFYDWGQMGCKFALQPGLDLNGEEYKFELGKPVRKFQKYADDIRLKKYRNIGTGKREGMFLYGYVDCVDKKGDTQYVWADNGAYKLYIRDQVGIFRDTDPSEVSPNPSNGKETPKSAMPYGDQNSGWFVNKYPIYPSDDPHKVESDFVVLRLAEVYYNLAEIKFNKGKKEEAEKLLNAVRKRYYPAGSNSLYPEDGSVITKQELLDEWGREFLGESMRRTTLCRFGVYNSGTWWDKEPDKDEHTKWVPLPRRALQTNPNLVQNDGYSGI